MAEPFEGSGAALYRQTAETLRQLAAKIRFDFCRRAKYHLRTRGRSTFAKPGRPFVCWKHGAAGRCHFGLASGLGISDRKDMTFGPRKDQIEQGMRSPPLKGRNGASSPIRHVVSHRLQSADNGHPSVSANPGARHWTAKYRVLIVLSSSGSESARRTFPGSRSRQGLRE